MSRAEPLKHSAVFMSTELMTSASARGPASVVRQSAVQVVRPMFGAKARKSRALLEGARIQPVKVALHFAFDFVERCFQEHAHVLLVIVSPVGQRYGGGKGAGDDKNVRIH